MIEHYQTIPLPNGDILPGLFPTMEWFAKIHNYIDFTGQSVLDLGCNEGAYCILASQAGATEILGIDSIDERLIKARELAILWNYSHIVYQQELIESFNPPKLYDVIIFSMIIHWLKDAEAHIKRIAQYAKNLVFVYRAPLEVGESGFRPRDGDLDTLLSRPVSYFSTLMETPNQLIKLAIYV